jgi:parallel beta-helix repeat protein
VNDGLFVSNSYNNIVKNNIVNGKPLVYLEAASDYVIANAGQVIGQVILVNCENITVENLELSNISVGLELVGTKNSKIMNNTANTNSYGIYLLSSSNNTLSNNIFVNDGLFVDFSYKNTVENNTVNSKPLVYLEEALDYKVEDAGQVILVNCENITVENLELSNTSVGVTLLGTNNSKIMNNTANSNNDDGIRLSSSSGNRLTGNTANFNSGASIWLSRSSNNNNLTENTVNSNNEYGIYLLWSNNNTLTKNTANANNEYGIYLFSSDNNNLTENTVNSNKKYGIYLSDFSDNNNLTKNTANANKKYGIYLIFSSNNNIIYNNYFNNTNNARDKGNNIWSITKTEGINIIGGPYLGGNYWSDYTGKDSDGDGLGNTLLPYDSSGDIKNGGDYLPLVKPSASALCDTGAGTYPQQEYKNTTGEAITCSTFNHANGETYTDRMPATRLV